MGVETEQFQQTWEPVLRPELRENKETKQFQQKWEPVLRPELRENKETERVGGREFVRHVSEIQIVPARGKHVGRIARHMRAADVAECRAMAGLTPRAGLRLSMKRSRAFTGLYDGRPEVMFGTSDLNVLAGIGSAWLLATDVVERHPREFLRLSLEWRPKLFERYSVLRNVVSVDNAASIRWLTWLGAEFRGRIDIGGHAFTLFELRK